MTKFAKRAIISAVTLFFSFSSAFAASGNSADLLKYIPADTPYVFASTEALPSDLAEKFEPTVDGILKAYQRVLKHVMSEQLVKMSSEEGGAEKAEQFRGLMEEVLSMMSLDGIRGVGIERESAFAFYGNGLLPVLRMELSDTSLFDAAIERFEEKAGKPLLQGEANGKKYKYANADKINLVVATLDGQVVMTVVPSKYDESQIARSLGITTPRANLKKSKTLRAIGKEYGVTEHMTGFVDFQRIAGIFAGDTTETDDELFTAIGEELPEVSEVCAGEIREMAGIAPRMVFGYSELSSEEISSAMIVELREDIAEGLATIPAAVPGLGMDAGGLLSLGFGMNPLSLRKFYESRLDAIEADPYECEMFAELQAGVTSGRAALDQPIPPVVYSFRGFVANVDDIQGMDMSTHTPPTSIDASILIAVENAESLVMMAAMMDPQIAALNLVPDGKPVKLEMAQIAEIAKEAFAALSDDALSVSLGDGAEANAADMLVASSSESTPFMSMNMDSARYYAMIGEAMENAEPEEGEKEMPAAIRKAMQEVLTLSGSMYERMSVEVQFTKRGVEINGHMKLND